MNDIVKIKNFLQDKNYQITTEELNKTLANLKSYQKKLTKLELEMKKKKNSKIVNLLTNILIILTKVIEILTTWSKNLRFGIAEFMVGKEHINRIEPTEYFDLNELNKLRENILDAEFIISAVGNFNIFLKENYYDAIPKNLYKFVDDEAEENNHFDETMVFELESLKFWPVNIRQKILTNLLSCLEACVAKNKNYSLENYQQMNNMINDELNTIANLSIENENLNEKIAEIEEFIKNSDQEIFESVRYLQYLDDLALIQEHHITEVYDYLLIPEKDELAKKITEMTQILENKTSITEQYELITNYITFIPALNVDLEYFENFSLATINNIWQQLLKTPDKDLMIEKLINHLETSYWDNLKEFISNYQKTQIFILQNLLIKIKMGETDNIDWFAIKTQFEILQKNEDKLLESITLCNKNYTNLIHLIVPNDQKKCKNIIAKLAITTQSIEDHTNQIIPIYDQTNPPEWIHELNQFDNKFVGFLEQQNFPEDNINSMKKKYSSQKQSQYRFAFYKERSLPQNFFKEFDILNVNQLSFHHWYQTGYALIDNFIEKKSLDKNNISFKEKEDELLTFQLSNLKKPAFYTTLIENLEAEQRTLLKDYPDLEQFLQNMFKNNEEYIATTDALYEDFLVSKASTLENNDDSKNEWYRYHYLLKSKYNHEFMRLFNYFGPKIYLLKFTNDDFAEKILQEIKTEMSQFEIDFLQTVGLTNNKALAADLENLIIKNLDRITKHNESTTFEMSSTSLEHKLPTYDIIQKYYECTNKINSLSYFRYFAELYDTNNPDETFKKDNFSNWFMIPYEILHQIKSEIFDAQNEKYQESIFKNKGHEMIKKIRFIQQKIINEKEKIDEIISKNKTEIKNDDQYSFDQYIISILRDIKAIFCEIIHAVIENHDKLNLEINDFNNAILNHLGKTIDFENIDTLPYHNLLIDWNKIDMHLEAFNLESLNSNDQKYIASNLLDTIQILIDELISNNLKLKKLDDDQIPLKRETSLFSDINSLVQLFCEKNAQQIFGSITKLNENNNKLNILLNKEFGIVIEKYKKEIEIGTDKLKELETELEKQQKIHQETLDKELETKLKDFEVMKNFIAKLETFSFDKDSLFKTILNLSGNETLNHNQVIVFQSVWNSISKKIEENKNIDKEKENLIQKIAKLEQEIGNLTTNVVSSDIKDDFIENYLKKLETWKIKQQWKTKTEFHEPYVSYKKEFKNKKINDFKTWVQLIILTKNVDLHNKINDDETANKIIKYALLTIIKACEPYSNVLDQVGKKSTKDWENDKNKPVIIQNNTDINSKLNSTPLFNKYQSFDDPQEIISNLIAEDKYQLIKEIAKMLPENMLNGLSSSSQIENKLSLKVKQISNDIKKYMLFVSQLNKNLSGSLSSLNSNSTTTNSANSFWKIWSPKKDSSR
ncbi:hypothetical protein [Spiroplasma eriocheiris]|uniref:Uncharacterized protein n=1 Tax=Spiroplasma eriocheiris TaxID=315358 RepID=A0A0H3XJM4_9MOLU|nr:hypothetical protein [Spiroplasma eriocheiris]AHF57599.1 hypothetical protein SPE_0471 [Spiroplasma eriocheiris CCTCC M 207170]AKM54056.1 hypothetical protein SERIO_v1c04770 [Spiroplasma eriocheiris]